MHLATDAEKGQGGGLTLLPELRDESFTEAQCRQGREELQRKARPWMRKQLPLQPCFRASARDPLS